jgi:hypothetical protein
MGNDGGSIPDRRDLVRNKPKVCPLFIFHFCISYVSVGRAPRRNKQTRPTRRKQSGFIVRCRRCAASSGAQNRITYPMQRPLQEPVVSCALGKLYNKDALLEYLLDKSSYGDGEEICGHIRSLKVRLLISSMLLFCSPFTFPYPLIHSLTRSSHTGRKNPHFNS